MRLPPSISHIRVVLNIYSGYNLKRKIASLDPISAEVFHKHAAKSEDVVNSTAKVGKAKDKGSLGTLSHQVEMETGFAPAQCLFCSVDSQTMDDNVDHMFKVHGMLIPNQEDLEDAEGLLSYLFTIITDFRECLYCGKTKETIEGIRSHMIDKCHCKIAFDEELDQFYDFDEGESEEGTSKKLLEEDDENAEADDPLLPPESPLIPHSGRACCESSNNSSGG